MFVYSNCIGTFLFGDDMNVEERVLFSDPISSNKKLSRNEWLDEELSLLKKINGKALFLGFKKEKLKNVSFTNDVKKLIVANEKTRKYEALANEVILKIAKLSVKESVEPEDLISQVSSSIQELDKSANLLTKRLREWYGLKNPELMFSTDNVIGLLNEDMEDEKISEMGAELAEEDVCEIKELSKEIENVLKLRARQEKYLEIKMSHACKNITAVAGAAIGAKLITSAGSLKNLATMPATKLQVLGAERSMFKFLRGKSKKMPRFGILHEHKLIASAEEREKGRTARLLSDKISIAARVDYFKGAFIGNKLLEDVTKRLK